MKNVTPAQTIDPSEKDNIAFLLSNTCTFHHDNDTIMFGTGNNAHHWHPFQSPTDFYWPPEEPQSRQYVYIPFLTPCNTTVTIS